MLSWNPIQTKDSCGSGGSSYRRTGNEELLPPFSARLFALKNVGFKLKMSNCTSPTLNCSTRERITNAFRPFFFEQYSTVGPRPLDAEGVLGVIS